MATTRDISTTRIQPTPAIPDAENLQVVQQSNQASHFFGQLGQLATQEYRTVQLSKATLEASQIIQYDGKGVLIPPTSFDATGLAGRDYNKTFKAAATDLYNASATEEARQEAQKISALHPTDPDAAGKKLRLYLDSKYEGLDPTVLPVIKPRMEAMLAGLTTSTMAAREQANQRTYLEQANRNANQFVIDAVEAGSTLAGLRGVDPSVATATQKSLLTQWEEVERMLVRSGRVPVEIDQLKEKIEVMIHGRGIANSMWNAVSGATASELPGLMANLQLQVKAEALKAGRYEAEVTGILNASISGAENYARALEANRQSYAQTIAGDYELRFAKITALASLPEGHRDKISPATAQTMFRTMQEDALSRTDLRPMEQARLLSASFGAVQQGNQLQQQFYLSALAQHERVIYSPLSTQNERDTAYGDLTRSLSNPAALAALGPAGISHAQKLVDAHFMSTKLPHIANVEHEFLQGTVSIPAMHQTVANLRAEGLVGEGPNQIPPEKIRQLLLKGSAAYEERNKLGDAAVTIANRWVKGQISPTAAEITAMHKAQPFIVTGTNAAGRPVQIPFDPLAHGANVITYLKNTGVVPKEAIDFIQGVKITSPPDDLKAAYTMVSNILDTHKNHQAIPGPDGADSSRIWLKGVIGDEAHRLMSSVGRVGPAAGSVALGDDMKVPSPPTNLGGKPDEVRAAMTAAILGEGAGGLPTSGFVDTVAEMLQRGLYSVIDQGVPSIFMSDMQKIPFKMWERNAQLSAFKEILANNRMSVEGDFVYTGEGATGLNFKNAPLTIDSDTLQALTQAGLRYWGQHGDNDRRMGKNPSRMSALAAWADVGPSIGLEPNGQGGYKLTLMPWNVALGKSAGVPMDIDTAKNMAIARAKAEGKFGSAAYIVGSVEMTKVMDSLGQFSYKLVGLEKNGAPIVFAEYKANDPIWKQATKKAMASVAREMRDANIEEVLGFLPTGAFFLGDERSKRLSGILRLAAGENKPSAEWANLVTGIQMAVRPFASAPRYDTTWAKLKTTAAQQSIARNGALSTILWGSGPIADTNFFGPEPVLPTGGSFLGEERSNPEPVRPEGSNRFEQGYMFNDSTGERNLNRFEQGYMFNASPAGRDPNRFEQGYLFNASNNPPATGGPNNPPATRGPNNPPATGSPGRLNARDIETPPMLPVGANNPPAAKSSGRLNARDIETPPVLPVTPYNPPAARSSGRLNARDIETPPVLPVSANNPPAAKSSGRFNARDIETPSVFLPMPPPAKPSQPMNNDRVRPAGFPFLFKPTRGAK